MSKPRPSPRRGGRRSYNKQTPPDGSTMSCEDSAPLSLTAKPQGKSGSGNSKGGRSTPPAKKSPRNKTTKKTPDSVKNKATKNKRGKKEVETDNDSDEEIEQARSSDSRKRKRANTSGDVMSAENRDNKGGESDDNSLVNHSIGEELMECLSKSNKKKKAMRSCINCGVLSPVSRAKKCPSCGKNLFNKSVASSREITCSKCDHHQKYSAGTAAVNCSNCNELLFKKRKVEDGEELDAGETTIEDKGEDMLVGKEEREGDGEKEGEGEEEASLVKGDEELKETDNDGKGSVPLGNKEDLTVEKGGDERGVSVGYGGSMLQVSDLPCPVNSDSSFQTGYSSVVDTHEEGDDGEDSRKTQKDATGNQIIGDETSQETVHRIIKRKILGGVDQSDPSCPPSKKPCQEEEEVNDDKVGQLPVEKTTGNKESLSLNIASAVSSAQTISSCISSPLLEYAQKISARLFIPPEINSQEVYRKYRPRVTNPRSGKANSAKNKRLAKESISDTSQQSLSPVIAASSSDCSASTQDSSQPHTSSSSSNSALPLPPPLVRSNEDNSTSNLTADASATGSTSGPEGPGIPPLITTSKPFHDSDVGHGTTVPSNRNTFYSSTLNKGVAPPLISFSGSEAADGRSVHGGQIISKNLYPEYQTSSVPPLLPVEQEDRNMKSAGVTRKMVIVDSRYTNNKGKDSSAPPALLTVPSSSPSPEQDHGGVVPTGGVQNPPPSTSTSVQAPPGTTDNTSNHNDRSEEPVEKVKHSKRKQKVCLVNTPMDDDNEGIIYEVPVKKKKKKKKKEKEKDREREGGHHSSSKSKSKSDLDRKARKKLKKEKRKDKEMEESCTMTESVDDADEESLQCGTTAEHQDEGKKEKPLLYSVKIKDCMIHQVKWGKFQMSLLVPQPQPQERDVTTPVSTSEVERANTPVDSNMADNDTSQATSIGGRRLRSRQRRQRDEEAHEEAGDTLVEPDSPSSVKDSSKKKKKRQSGKAKVKVETEADHVESDHPLSPEPPTNTSLTDEIHEDASYSSSLPPCFSIYELRNKIFSDFQPRIVHVFTYKLRIQTHRPPLYWIHILKRIGGLPDTCHMCRLLDVESVKQMCAQHHVKVPECLDELIGPNPSMHKRKLVDLSDQDPSSFILNPDLLYRSLPYTAFMGTKQSATRSTADSEQTISESSLPKRECRKTKSYNEHDDDDQMVEEDEEEDEPMEEQCKDDEGKGTQCQSSPAMAKNTKRKYSRKNMAPPLKVAKQDSCKSNPASPDSDHTHSHKHSNSSIGTGKKKPCPNCGYSMLRKSKKCVNCGKPFGVFTFGRRQCTYCNHINLARMSACFRCGQSLDKAPTAVPKISEIFDGPFEAENDPTSVVKHDFKFGVKRKRRVQSVPSPPSSSANQQQGGRGGGGATEVNASYDSADEVFQNDYDVSGSPAVLQHQSTSKKRKAQSGYRYGKIPWNDADLALVVTPTGTSKLCLQEVCAKVLRYHQKSEVFELVKNLNLHLDPADSSLLKKLQALGLHPTRSPVCRLIATEDLFALMDALEELVPDEVHQYMGNIGSNNSLVANDGVVVSHGSSSSPTNHPLNPSSSSAAAAAAVRPVSLTVGDDREHGFESTLHELECSDGQSFAMLRSWDGDHFLCLLEVWRRYFPEVNRSHLTATIKRLDIETKIPTSQQTNLLRTAGIISVRGAPGRLIKINDVQRVLDDFGIMLTIGGINYEETKKNGGQFTGTHRATVHSSKHFSQASKKSSELTDLAGCMTLLLDSVESSTMESLLLADQEKYTKQLEEIQSEIQGQAMQENILHNHILSRRELCAVLADEMSFLTVTNHSMMAELVHLSYSVKQTLGEIDDVIDFSQIVQNQECI